jgi:hypothetical protein
MKVGRVRIFESKKSMKGMVKSMKGISLVLAYNAPAGD